jgi:hypothetical protein
VFGHSGIVAFKDAPVLDRFVQAAPDGVTLTDRQYGFKTLFRPGVAAKIGPHRPTLSADRVSGKVPTRWVDGTGTAMPKKLLARGWSVAPEAGDTPLAQINHYMIRSADVFALHNLVSPPLGSEPAPLSYSDYEAFNLNHDTDQTIQRHQTRVAAERVQLLALPGVAKAHAASVASMATLIAAMRKTHKADAALKRVLAPVAARALVRDQQAWIADKRKPAKADATPAGPDAADLAPRWLADLRRSGFRRGWYHSDQAFAAQFTERSRDTLIVSFDNLSNVNDASLARESWGYGFYAAEGWSHLGVMAFEKNWYRDETLFDFMEDKARAGFFEGFGRVILTGTSMGAYAATAFANLVPGCTVVAFSPQSTLDKKLVPWEERFASGRKRDWSGRYRDATSCCGRAAAVLIIFDPYFPPDRMHAERYAGDNIHHLKSWYSSHKSAQFMRRADILKTVMRAAVAGQLSPENYYRMFRSRRDLVWYYNGLADHLLARGHKKLAARLADHLVTIQRPGVARAIQDRL